MDNIVILDPDERLLKEATDKFDGFQAQLYKVETEIALLVHIQKTLEENISILKTRQIITKALEYRKAKEDLSKVHENLIMLKINRNSLEHSTEKARQVLIKSREKYVLSLETKRSRVIEVDFRRNDDRQDRDPE